MDQETATTAAAAAAALPDDLSCLLGTLPLGPRTPDNSSDEDIASPKAAADLNASGPTPQAPMLLPADAAARLPVAPRRCSCGKRRLEEGRLNQIAADVTNRNASKLRRLVQQGWPAGVLVGYAVALQAAREAAAAADHPGM